MSSKELLSCVVSKDGLNLREKGQATAMMPQSGS